MAVEGEADWLIEWESLQGMAGEHQFWKLAQLRVHGPWSIESMERYVCEHYAYPGNGIRKFRLCRERGRGAKRRVAWRGEWQEVKNP